MNVVLYVKLQSMATQLVSFCFWFWLVAWWDVVDSRLCCCFDVELLFERDGFAVVPLTIVSFTPRPFHLRVVHSDYCQSQIETRAPPERH